MSTWSVTQVAAVHNDNTHHAYDGLEPEDVQNLQCAKQDNVEDMSSNVVNGQNLRLKHDRAQDPQWIYHNACDAKGNRKHRERCIAQLLEL